MTRGGAGWWLAGLLTIAFAHATTQALLRPLYQVSDEINYLLSVQFAVTHEILDGTIEDRTVASCVNPPDGVMYTIAPGGGKTGFHWAAGSALLLFCKAGAGVDGLPMLRVALGLSLPALVLVCWWLYRLHLPGLPASGGIAACSLLALHPVLAKYSGAVTPDSWANVFSAVALASGTLVVLRRERWMHYVLLLVATAAALGWKDNTSFLLISGALAIGTGVWRSRTAGSRVRIILAMVAVGVGVALLSASRIGGVLQLRTASRLWSFWEDGGRPYAFVQAVVADAVGQFPATVWSLWASLGNAGASDLVLGDSVTWLALLATAVAAAGVLRFSLRRPAWLTPQAYHELRPAVIYWSVAVACCYLQAPARQAMLSGVDVHQGRWLFPAAVPLAILFALGLFSWVRSPRRWLTAYLCFTCVVSAQAWISIVRYYYVRLPTSLSENDLYVRATSGITVDDDRVLTVIHSVHTTAVTTVGIAALILLLIGATCLLMSVPRRDADGPMDHA